MMLKFIHIGALSLLCGASYLVGMNQALTTTEFLFAVRTKNAEQAEQIATALLEAPGASAPPNPFSIDSFGWKYASDNGSDEKLTYKQMREHEWTLSPYTPVHWA